MQNGIQPMEALRRHEPDEGQDGGVSADPSAVHTHDGPRIRCPKCTWEPRATDMWSCESRCRMLWNTFDTGGRCPRCQKQWLVTECLRCHQFSFHVDWYVLNDRDQ